MAPETLVLEFDGPHSFYLEMRVDLVLLILRFRALLSKLIVRGLFPGNEPWKKFLHAALQTVAPRFGMRDRHSWAAGMRFVFSDAPVAVPRASPFMRSILRIWSSMRAVLVRRESRCREEAAGTEDAY